MDGRGETPLDEYGRRRDELVAVVERLRLAAEGLDSPREDEGLAQVVRRLAEGRFKLVVIGEFNRGKSTFINALLGRRILPTAVRPTTATINVISWSAEPTARVRFLDGSDEVVALDTLGEYVTVAGAAAERVSVVEIGYPTPLCEQGVQIVDTPGVNDLDHQREEITYGYLPGSDAAVLVLDGEAAVSRSELVFLRERILRNDVAKVFIVLNKVDQLDPADLAEVEAYARKALADVLPEPRLYPLSARDALAAKESGNDEALARSGLLAFETELGRFLVAERGTTALQGARTRALRLGRRLLTVAALRREGLLMEAAELAERAARIEPTLAEHERMRGGLKARLGKAADELGRMAEAKIREGMAKASKELDEVVAESAIGPDFVKDLLPDLIRRKVTDLLEENQKVVAERLGELERRAIADVSALLDTLDTVVVREFSVDGKAASLDALQVARSEGNRADMAYEVGSLVAGGVVSLVGVMLMGVLGIIPAFFGARYVRDLISERQKTGLRADLTKTLHELLRQAEDQLVTETRERVSAIVEDMRAGLGRQLEDAAAAVRRSLELLRAEQERSAEHRAGVETKLAGAEAALTAQVKILAAGGQAG